MAKHRPQGDGDGAAIAVVAVVGVVGALGFFAFKRYLAEARAQSANNQTRAIVAASPDCKRWVSSTTSAPWASINAATIGEVLEWRRRFAAQGRLTTEPKCDNSKYGGG